MINVDTGTIITGVCVIMLVCLVVACIITWKFWRKV